MYYWNHDNFTGLVALGEYFARRPRYDDLAKYCETKEQGLNKLANSHALSFSQQLLSWPRLEQCEAVEELVRLDYQSPQVHQFLSYPVKQTLVSLASDWLRECPNELSAVLCCALLTWNLEYFEQVLVIDCDNQIAVTALLQAHMYSLDYHTHHLDEGYFIGGLAEAKESVTAAKSLLSKLISTPHTNYLNEEVEYYENLIRDWQRFISAERGGRALSLGARKMNLVTNFPKNTTTRRARSTRVSIK